MTTVPDFHFSKLLHQVVTEARKRQQIPPASVAASPNIQPEQLETIPSAGLDFSIAESLFSSQDWMSVLGQSGAMDQPASSGAALPFFPLSEWSSLNGSSSSHQLSGDTLDMADSFNPDVNSLGWDLTQKPFWME